MKLKLEAAKTLALVLLVLTIALGSTALPAFAQGPTPVTPIQHLVVIFNENISFDHYFGTYPFAKNLKGEPKFNGTTTTVINGLTSALMTNNPNLNPANGGVASNPFRLAPSQAVTSDQDHGYTDEQIAYDAGLLDLFPSHTGFGAVEPMAYFDGNTVTAMWNYAQFFAMSDNSYSTTFGPSTPGVINLTSGQTNGAINILN